MTDSSASGQAGLGIVTIPSDEPETSGGENATLHDEHIAYMMQQMINMQIEIDRLRNLTNLSISLNTPLSEQNTSATIPPTFPPINLLSPQHFPQTLHPTKPTRMLPIHLSTYNNPTHNKITKTNQPIILHYSRYSSTSTCPNYPHSPQNHQKNQHIPAAHISIPNMQYVPPVYVAKQQPFTTPIPTMPHPEVDPYEEMEREAGPKEILKNGFEPGRGLGLNLDEITEPIQLPDQKYTFNLGYEPTPKEISLEER
ncbi:hypothetical protein HAX54_047007 [Datura stramonium]|uniref:G-patch domain-containing protein n=1 Tax=Datura stramonium TaxID=4076 RepID=A0ABS8WJQ7_DATST|nr:hypothetical protein [Datura stramonium]